MRKYIAEFLGTLVLVLFGCGVAVVSGGNLVATALAFGLAIVACAYVIGPISGCHVNPAVSFAMALNKKLSWKDFGLYCAAQVLGAIAGAFILWLILKSIASPGAAIPLGTNGFGKASAHGITVWGALLTEVVLTYVFIYTILGVTGDESKSNIAGLVIGLTLAFVHLLGINLTGTSVNPARSFGPALLKCGDAIKQVWLFIVAPFAGSALAAVTYKYLNRR